MRVALAASGVGVALVVLVTTAIRAASTYYFTLPQFEAMGHSAVGKYVQVNGTVSNDVVFNGADAHLTFDIVPVQGTGTGTPLPVVYQGAEPDAFVSGISVVVVGRLAAGGTFDATQIMVKCPSHYTAAPPGDNGASWPSSTT